MCLPVHYLILKRKVKRFGSKVSSLQFFILVIQRRYFLSFRNIQQLTMSLDHPLLFVVSFLIRVTCWTDFSDVFCCNSKVNCAVDTTHKALTKGLMQRVISVEKYFLLG